MPQSPYPTAIYLPRDLIEAGFTYGYLSPENFARADAGYVISQNMPGRAFLLPYPGGVPSRYDSSDLTAIEKANRTLKGLLSLKNVHQIPYENLAASIASIHIEPRSQIRSNATWHTRRRDLHSKGSYVFVYNTGDYSTGSIIFEYSGADYFLNAWTGEEAQIVHYTNKNGYMTIPIALQPEETRLLRLST
ncbi:uncharacterized protein KD926_011668 [Aspergillus affinis]|uniref:uncharacterized protein n=1 Tax=Aspergillus affinis TaxID=1070780 RepID=UPI0022FE386D|nr:uncharacterized protein KD926_011668 [Aspergillus affinis]KAI9044698.1 hypothetical protein KD926_011668 [Aspergillus affinis]